MTVRTGRRRRTTAVAGLIAIAGLVLTGGLTYAGARTLWNSTEGSDAGTSVDELFFPETPTALLAGVDDDGALASLAVIVVQPDGAGGSVIPLPVSADATSGEGDERLPIAETVALQGIESVEREVEIAVSLSLDAVEVATADRLAELLEPLGEVEVDLPEDVVDAAGDVVVEAGSSALTPEELGLVLTARDPDTPAAEQFAAAAAVWAGVAETVGDGIGDPPPTGPDGSVVLPTTAEGALAAAMAGELSTWAVRSRPIEPERNPRGVDVALLDRPELAMIFGQIAPGKVSAPNPSLSARVVAAFSDAQLAEYGWTNAEVAYRAVSQILFLRGNVLSVDTTPDSAPETTRVELGQPGINTSGAEQVFGELDVVEAEARIVGVDAVVYLGESYLRFLVEAGVDPAGTVESVPAEDPEPGVEPVSTEAAAATTND